ncbi:MAG TPA: SRPBCC family protein [Pyrinomonadaceae bacterium]|jgi:choline monooxygenase|nr:SRPBCC family protein [Pyrinomonadaceae bacterium]
MSIFEINSDIRYAETLSSEFYTDEKYFLESKEKIFARSWQMVGTTDETDNLVPFTILENFLDEPGLITKTNENFTCLSNVCTHRGKILVEEKCKANGIRCGYHGRRFDLDGKFLSMPEFEEAANFPSEKDDLTRIPFDILGRLLFASINPFASFEDFFASVKERLTWLDWTDLKFSEKLSRDYFVDAHWALYCENYLEGFHIPFVHQSLNEAIDYGTYTTETFRFASLQTGFAKHGENAFGFNSEIAALYFFIFPNLMLNFYPWGLSVNIVKPLQTDLTKVSYLTFVADESKLNKGAGADLSRVEFEDQSVVESVQKGINSRFYEKGRYSPTREQGTHHFHQLIAEFMNS